MGSSPIVTSGGGTGGWFRWRWHSGNGVGKSGGGNKSGTGVNSNSEQCAVSSMFAYFLSSFVVLGLIGSLYGRLLLSSNVLSEVAALGCAEDNEGSWAIGIFYGDSPFSLKPIEAMNIWKDKSAAWPVANPVVTCASPSKSGFPSNFVADPFLYQQEDDLYLFYETKNSITMQGDIGVSRSVDKGATWQHLGIALDEDWHLSYPYVFSHNGNIYMMPEGSMKGDLRLYRATNFPLSWTLEKVIMKKPLVDAFMIPYEGKFWLFGSDHSGIGTKKNGQLEIWYSNSPLGPWKPHKKNPIYNTDKTMGARNGGRPFVYNGNIYRVGQDCGETYGRRTRVFKIKILTNNEYKEIEVPLGLEESRKGRNAWNGVRSHHLDVQQLRTGEWIAVLDGDRVPSGDIDRHFILGLVSIVFVASFVVLVGMLLGVVKCIVPLSWCPHNTGKRSDTFLTWERSSVLSSKLRLFCSRLNHASSALRARIKLSTCSGIIILALIIVVSVILTCTGVEYIYGGNGANEPYPLNNHYSQFTMVTMTYDARIWNLKMYIKHYSRCASVREIVVVWNKGIPPELSDFDTAVPVRIRVEKQNSLNNRFKTDPLIKTRAVLELDDDIMMTCDDIERGFRVWREHPDRIVGFYPRLVNGFPFKYRGEKHARKHAGYNMILTGAAFIDSKVAFEPVHTPFISRPPLFTQIPTPTPTSFNFSPMTSTTTLSPVTTSQLCSSKNGLSSPSNTALLKCVRGGAAVGKVQRMRVSCMATSIPADRVPDMGKRQLMNLLLLGAISLPSVGMLVPYTYFFVPPGSGSAGGGVVAKDALGNDVIASDWINTHGPGDRTLTQGLKGDPTYLVVEKDKTLATYGINAVCTHLGCVVPWNAAENKFICPCHGSQYNNQGKVVRGPAPLSLALVHADVDDGKVVFVPWVETDFRTGENPWWA